MEKTTPAASDKATTSEKTILLVEDDYDIRAMLVMILNMEGYNVVRAANGKDAMDILRNGLRPHLILLDLMMPVMNGWQFREAISQAPSLSHIPIIVISGDGRAAAQRIEEKVTCFLKKPIDLDEFLEKISEYTSGPALN